jgi:hypothetical protein
VLGDSGGLMVGSGTTGAPPRSRTVDGQRSREPELDTEEVGGGETSLTL